VLPESDVPALTVRIFILGGRVLSVLALAVRLELDVEVILGVPELAANDGTLVRTGYGEGVLSRGDSNERSRLWGDGVDDLTSLERKPGAILIFKTQDWSRSAVRWIRLEAYPKTPMTQAQGQQKVSR
jgi:hypothetical protein